MVEKIMNCTQRLQNKIPISCSIQYQIFLWCKIFKLSKQAKSMKLAASLIFYAMLTDIFYRVHTMYTGVILRT